VNFGSYFVHIGLEIGRRLPEEYIGGWIGLGLQTYLSQSNVVAIIL